MRRAAPVLLVVAVVAVLVIGLKQASSGGETAKLPPFDVTKALAGLEGSPAPLAALHAQHDQLLGGGTKAYRTRVKALAGHPVVVNKWGEWCPPCRREFPIFQRAGADLGKRVAFLGINAFDNEGEAARFLKETPVLYPSYEDPRGNVSRAAGAPGSGAPTTLFLDARGKLAFVHQGEYRSLADLRADIKRYLRV